MRLLGKAGFDYRVKANGHGHGGLLLYYGDTRIPPYRDRCQTLPYPWVGMLIPGARCPGAVNHQEPTARTKFLAQG
jgi:hypothetical protein